MTFTKNSIVVRVWVQNVQSGLYTYDQVPDLFNLREIVKEVLEESTK